MSEPSPEANQAALLPCPFCGNQAVTEFEYGECTYMTQCESCGAGTCANSDRDETIKDWNSRSDTTTAKAREELEWHKRDARRAAACADEMAEKLRLTREELDELQDLKEFWEKRAERAEGKLAHQQPRRWPSEVPLFGKPAPANQQPSAPTADCKALPGYKGCATHHWFGSECPYSKRLPQYALPDAFFVYLGETPLAGPMTESAASESAKAITVAFTQRPAHGRCGEDCAEAASTLCDAFAEAYPVPLQWDVVAETLQPYFAQVSAPLVEALEYIGKVIPHFEYVLLDKNGRDIWLHDFIRAALTGTGEKQG